MLKKIPLLLFLFLSTSVVAQKIPFTRLVGFIGACHLKVNFTNSLRSFLTFLLSTSINTLLIFTFRHSPYQRLF